MKPAYLRSEFDLTRCRYALLGGRTYLLHLFYQPCWGGGVPRYWDLWQIVACFCGLGADRTILDADVPHQFPQSAVKNCGHRDPVGRAERSVWTAAYCHYCDQQAASLQKAFGGRWSKINQGFWICNLSQINWKTWAKPKITKSVPKGPYVCDKKYVPIISQLSHPAFTVDP